MARRTRVISFVMLVLTLTACDPAPQTSSSSTNGVPTTPSPSSGSTTQPDPNVPYSPSPSELVPRVTGYVTETLTLPTTDGEDATMLVTLSSTAIDTEFVDGYRSTSVWVSLENPGDEPWSGIPAAAARIADEIGNVFEPVAPTPADLHPDPERYDASNLDLTERVTIDPGDRLDGVIVFRPTGGNRPITISISLDGGNVWGEWTTSLGPF